MTQCHQKRPPSRTDSPQAESLTENDKNKYWLRYVRELKLNFITWGNIKEATTIKYKLHKEGNNYWSELDPTYKNKLLSKYYL